MPANEEASRMPEAIRRLVDLYTAWEKPDEAAKWQEQLDIENTKLVPQPDSK